MKLQLEKLNKVDDAVKMKHLRFESHVIEKAVAFGEKVSENPGWIAAANLISREQHVNELDEVEHDGRIGGVEASLGGEWKDEKQPQMRVDNRDVMENDFPNHALTQVQHSVNQNYGKLDHQHE